MIFKRVCPYCQKEFETIYPTKKYCTKQHQKHAHTSKRRGKAIRNVKRENPNLCKICMICGLEEPDILEVHHRDRDANNDYPSNLQILCPNCHKRIHKYGYFPVKEYKFRNNHPL